MLRPKAAPRKRAHELVLATGNEYAYEFVATSDPERLTEVRVRPGGRVTYTPCDLSGRPVGKARSGIFRAGGVRGQRPALLATPAIPFLGFIAELVL